MIFSLCHPCPAHGWTVVEASATYPISMFLACIVLMVLYSCISHYTLVTTYFPVYIYTYITPNRTTINIEVYITSTKRKSITSEDSQQILRAQVTSTPKKSKLQKAPSSIPIPNFGLALSFFTDVVLGVELGPPLDPDFLEVGRNIKPHCQQQFQWTLLMKFHKFHVKSYHIVYKLLRWRT